MRFSRVLVCVEADDWAPRGYKVPTPIPEHLSNSQDILLKYFTAAWQIGDLKFIFPLKYVFTIISQSGNSVVLFMQRAATNKSDP